MLVVADTSPLHYLILIGEIDLLPKLYAQVYAPDAVVAELEAENASELVKAWIDSPPEWFRAVPVEPSMRSSLRGLHAGERDAIELALRMEAAVVLMDERRGRLIASSLNLQVRGTLAIVLKGAQAGFCEFESCIDKLKDTNIYLAKHLIEQVRQEFKATLRKM